MDIDADVTSNPNATVGDGQMYAFQLPVLAGEPLNVTTLGGVRSFQSNLPPTLANSGLNMYWSVARSQVRCWAGEENLKRSAFDVGNTESVELERGIMRSAAPKAPPVVTAGMTPFAYGPSAANEIFGLNNDCSILDLYTFPEVTTVLTNKVLLSLDEVNIFAATPTGNLLLFDAANLAAGPIWTYPLTGGVAGELATSADGLHVFVADVSGVVHAIKVSDTPSTPVPGPTPNVTAPAPALAPVPATMPSATALPSIEGTPGEIEPTMSNVPSASAMPVADAVPTGTEPSGPSVPSSGSAPSSGSVPSSPIAAPVPPVFAPTPAPNPTSAAASTVAYLGALAVMAVALVLV